MTTHVVHARARRWGRTAVAGLLALSVVACSDTPSAPPAAVSTLTIAIAGPPTLDPYKANLDPINIPTVALAYAPLIRMNADRTFSGEIAESFGYSDNQNKVFHMKIRPGVQFADGTPVDAAAVVASLQYLRKVSPKAQSWLGTIDSITAPDRSTVVVTNKTPNPVMPLLFSQAVLTGALISPAGLADPAKLAQQTFGAGQYQLDPANTVPNDHYTYTANPRYWNAAETHWKKVVVRVIPDSSATVQAIQAKQVDYAALNADAGPAVSAAGLPFVRASVAMVGLVLADRDGTIAPALKDIRVRQALNYAINRDAITKTIFGTLARPTSQTAAPGFDGYAAALDNRYPYDPAKAKSLLTEAGYAGGFTLKVETQGFLSAITQAVVAQWKEVGVNVELVTDTQVPQWIDHVMSRSFPVAAFGYGNLPTYLTSLDLMRPTPNPFNPFATRDDQLSALLDAAMAEPDPTRQASVFQQATARAAELAWLAPVSRIDGIGVLGPRVVGSQTVADNGLPSVLTIRPAQ